MSGRPSRDAHRRQQAAQLGDRANLLSSRAVEVTTPVYWPDDRGDPETIGSATLVRLGEARFLVTAAHVLDLRHKRQLAAVAGPGLIPVGGEVTRVFSPLAPSPAEDPVDIGIVRLGGASWFQLPESAFAGWFELDHSASPISRNSHLVIGYPCTKQRGLLKGHELSAYAYRVSGLESPEDTYKIVRADPQTSLLIGFEKRRTWGPGGRVTAPDLQGMSGGGIWRFGRYLTYATEPARLSAVIVEWHRTGRHKYVMGTRIRPIIAAIADRYPDVKEFVERQTEGAT